MTPLHLQCHLWVMHLLNHLGWSHQTWHIRHPRAVQIDLLHLDVGLGPPGTDFLGGTKILVCWPILDQLAFRILGLTCTSSYVSWFVCMPFFRDVQCRIHFTGNTLYLPSTTHFSIQGNSLNATAKVDSWAGKGVDQRIFGPVATPLPEYK